MVSSDVNPVDFLKDIHPNPDEFICISVIYPKDRLAVIPVADQKRVFLPVGLKDDGKLKFRPHDLFMPINIWINRKDLFKKLSLLRALNEKQWGIYYSTAGFGDKLNEYRNPARDRGNVKRIQVLFADYDFPTDGSRAFEAGQGFDLLPPPNYVVRTSENKLQTIWLVDRPMNFETAAAALLYIATKTEGDPAVKDLSRVLRLPKFKNTKLKPEGWLVVAEKRHNLKLEDPLVEDLASAGRSIRASARASTIKKGRRARSSALPPPKVEDLLNSASASLTLPDLGPVPIARALEQWKNIHDRTNDKHSSDWGMCCYLRGVGASADTMFSLMRRAHGDDDGYKGHDNYYRDTARRCLEEYKDREL